MALGECDRSPSPYSWLALGLGLGQVRASQPLSGNKFGRKRLVFPLKKIEVAFVLNQNEINWSTDMEFEFIYKTGVEIEWYSNLSNSHHVVSSAGIIDLTQNRVERV